LSLLGEHERELDNRRLGTRDYGDVGIRVELDAVVRAIAASEGLPQFRQPAERRVPMNVGPLDAACQCLDDVRRGPSFRVSTPEIDE
jgi:hypothetical protein